MPYQLPLDFSQFSGKTFQLQDPKFQQNIPSFPKQEQDISRFFTKQQQGTYILHKDKLFQEANFPLSFLLTSTKYTQRFWSWQEYSAGYSHALKT